MPTARSSLGVTEYRGMIVVVGGEQDASGPGSAMRDAEGYDIKSGAWRALAPLPLGKHAVGAFLTELFAAFPDLQFNVGSRLALGDFVAEEWCMRGTHRGPFMGIPATGRRVEIPGMSLVKLVNGRFLSDQFYFDSGLVLRQMGLLPPLAVLDRRVTRAVLWLLVHGMALMRGLAKG